MIQHYVQKINTMDARDNNPFHTTYYNALTKENQTLLKFIKKLYDDMHADLTCEPFTEHFYLKEIGKMHRKQDKSLYTVMDTIYDLYHQINDGKNATESLIVRWNKAFKDSNEHQIEIIIGPRPDNRLPGHLFEFE